MTPCGYWERRRKNYQPHHWIFWSQTDPHEWHYNLEDRTCTKLLSKCNEVHSCRWILPAPWASGTYRDSRETIKPSSLLNLFGKRRDQDLSSLQTSLHRHVCLSLSSSSSSWDPGGSFPLCHLKPSFIVQTHHCKQPLVFPATVASEGTPRQTSPGAMGGRRWRAARLISCAGMKWTASDSQQRWDLKP